MGISSDSISLLFRAKGDTDDAKKAFSSLKTQVAGDLGAIRNTVGTEMANAGSSIASLASPALIATGAIAAIGTAVIGAGVALFDFTKQAAEYGSELYDARVQTGLTAESISALKLAADGSGGSLDKAAGAVAKLNSLLGQAANGSEKAQATLDKYNITAKDTDTAFQQAVKTIASYTDQGEKAAAMQALFKDRTGELGKLIDQVGGDFAAYTEEARRLGVVLSEEDLRASDQFGDSLGVLGAQAKIAGVKFASELMPMCIQAMNAISDVMANNQGVAREWGQTLVRVIDGAQFSLKAFSTLVFAEFIAIDGLLGTSSKNWSVWSYAVRGAVMVATGGLSEVLRMLDEIGKRTGNQVVSGTAGDGTDFGRPLAKPSSADPWAMIKGATRSPRTTSPRASSGESDAERERRKAEAERERAEREAEQARTKAVRDAEQTMRATLEVFRAGYAQRIALQDQQLANGLTNELNYIRDVGRIHLEALLDEKTLQEQLLKNTQLNADERRAIEQRLLVLNTEIATQRIETSTKVTSKIKKDVEDEAAARRKAHEEWQQQVRDSNAQFEVWRKQREEQERAEEEDRQKKVQAAAEQTNKTGVMGGIGQTLGVDLVSVFDPDQINVLKSQAELIKDIYTDMASTAGQAIGSMIQGLGNLAVNWLLTGKFSARAALQMAAGILLGVAIQSGVKAWFEHAEAAAAAARWDFASAALHETASAMYLKTALIAGGIGVGAGLLSRAVGGGSQGSKSFANAANQSLDTGQGDKGRGGKLYSSKEDQIREEVRNAPGSAVVIPPQKIQIDIGLSKNGLLEVLRHSANYGEFRQMVIDIAAA